MSEVLADPEHHLRLWGPATYFPTAAEVAAGLDLDPAQWPVRRTDMLRRWAVGPGGETTTA